MGTEITDNCGFEVCVKGSEISLDSGEIYLCNEDLNKARQQNSNAGHHNSFIEEYLDEFDKMYVEPLRKAGQAILEVFDQARYNFEEGIRQNEHRILKHYDGY